MATTSESIRSHYFAKSWRGDCYPSLHMSLFFSNLLKIAVLLVFLETASASTSCYELFKNYAVGENTSMVYQATLSKTLVTAVVYSDFSKPPLAPTHVYDLSRLDFSSLPPLSITPLSQMRIASATSIRQRLLVPRKNEKIEVDVFNITHVSEFPIKQDIRSSLGYSRASGADFYSKMHLGEVQGQPVVVSTPLKIDENGNPLYSDRLFKLVKLQAAGLISPIGIGRDPLGAYRIIMPLHEPGSARRKDFTAKELLVIEALFVELAKLGIPFLDQRFELNFVSQLQEAAEGFVELSIGPQGKLIFTDIMFVHRPPLIFHQHFETHIISQPSDANNYAGPLAFRRFDLASNSSHFVDYITLLIEKKNYERALQLLYLNFLRQKMTEDYTHRENLRNIGIFVAEDVEIKVTGWVSQKGFVRHADKHGAKELGLSQSEYEAAAKEFFESYDYSAFVMTRQVSKTIFKHNLETGEFGLITSDGKIITYYFVDPSRRDADIMHYLGENAFAR